MHAINKHLKVLDRMKGTDKGEVGEDIIFLILQNIQKKINMDLYHSYIYPYIPSIPGNIVKENGNYIEITKDGLQDEIDIVVVTEFRIFLVEVKAYRANDIKFTEDWTYHLGKADHKSVLSQSEKHARHFYHTFWEYLPDGDENYIVPLVVLVDKCKFKDTRTKEDQDYLPACLRNELVEYFLKLNTPLKYRLNVNEIERAMEEKKISYKKLKKGLKTNA